MSHFSGVVASVTLAALVVLSMAGAFSTTAAPATASEDSLSTDAPTPIDSCTTLSSSGVYHLTDDVATTTNRSCIRIRASDVVLDGEGRTVASNLTDLDREQEVLGGSDYQTGVGVVVAETNRRTDATARRLTNVTVRNLTVSRWDAGVAFENVARASVRDVTARRNDDGIVLQNTTDSRVQRVTVARNDEDGLGLFRATDSDLSDIDARDNRLAGIAVLDSTDATITDASAVGNHGDGVVLADGTRHRLRNVTASANAVGILLLSTTGSVVTDSIADANAFAGVLAGHATNTTLSRTRITNTTGTAEVFSAPSGVLLFDANGTRIRDVTLRDNRRWSVLARNGSDAALSNVSLSTARLTADATDVALRPAGRPTSLPRDGTTVGPRVAVTATSPDAALRVEMHPTDGAGDVSLWQYDDKWSEVAPAPPDDSASAGRVTNLSVGDRTLVALLRRNATDGADRRSETTTSQNRTNESVVNETVTTPDASATISIHLDCETLRVWVEPPDVPYSMELTYSNTETGERTQFVAGPLSGPTTDPFGRTKFVPTRVRVQVYGWWYTWHLPEDCRTSRAGES